MTNKRILQIIREEAAHQEGILFEGMVYVPQRGYRNNQLMEEYGRDGRQLLTEGTIDTIQAVLGWAGFIPVVGDAIDAINALIYFIRNKFWDGMFSIIPVVGNGISKVLQKAFDAIGPPLVKIFKQLTKNGKGAATSFFNLFKGANKTIRAILKPVLDAIKGGAGDIATFLGKINLHSLNKTILDWSYGWVGLPTSIVNTLSGFVNQLKKFFGHIAKPPKAITQLTQKSGERGLHHVLLPHEEEAARKVYKTNEVDKKKYPTVEKFIEAQIELKNKKEITNKMKEVGDVLNKKGIQMIANLLKKPGNEIKLWSPQTSIVKLVQQAVGVKPDGTFGTDTEKAVKRVQRKHGLAQDGVIGADTWAKIT